MAGVDKHLPRAKLSVERLDLPPGGGTFAMRRPSIGLFLVDQDRHRIAVGSDKRRHIPLKAGEGWILPADATGLCEFDEALTFLKLEIPANLLSDVGFERHRAFEPVVGSIDPLLAELVRQAADDREGFGSLYRETMQLALAAHLARLLNPVPGEAPGIEDRRLRRALEYIHDNLSADLSLDDLAAQAAMSRFHFARAFSRTVGLSPLQYVIGERMNRARVLLRTTRLTVAAIAASVGYEDVSRFGRHFSRHVGASPAAFRAEA
jgi:AraC family transcriptional regulator